MEKYSYTTTLFDNGRQYSPDELENEKIVDARYIKVTGFEGNPYVEALPKGFTYTEMQEAFNRPIFIPSQAELQELDEYEREDSVDMLNDFRIFLPFHAMVEKQFHRALVQSYRKRKLQQDQRINVKLVMEDAEVITHSQMVPKNMSDPVSGFTLLGDSGCGKSTSINMVLSHYPQTIIHNRDSWEQQTQIVYLLVHCTPNSNFSKLYENIGEAIDSAVGNFNDTYKLMFKHGTLGDKYDLLKQLIKRFMIGVIILDEIELIDLKSTKESSFETFLALTNETGVALCVAGTMDAYSRLFSKARTARRCGMSILASRYCFSKEIFRQIVSFLQIYHWTPKMIDFAGDESRLDALYKSSHGVISDLIEIYKMIQKDQIKPLSGNRQHPEVTADYITDIGKKYFEILQRARALENDTLDKGNDVLSYDELMRLNTAQERIEEEEMNQRYQEIISDPATMKYTLLQRSVLDAIKSGSYGYRTTSIERAFSVIMRRPDSSLEMPLDEVVKKTLIYLDGKREERHMRREKAEKKKADLEKMQAELLENNEKESADEES